MLTNYRARRKGTVKMILCKSSIWDDRSLCYSLGLHLLYYFFHLEREQFAQEQCQVHRFVVVLECTVVCQLNAVLI